MEIHSNAPKLYYGFNFVQYKNDQWASAKREFNNPQICFCAKN